MSFAFRIGIHFEYIRNEINTESLLNVYCWCNTAPWLQDTENVRMKLREDRRREVREKFEREEAEEKAREERLERNRRWSCQRTFAKLLQTQNS